MCVNAQADATHEPKALPTHASVHGAERKNTSTGPAELNPRHGRTAGRVSAARGGSQTTTAHGGLTEWEGEVRRGTAPERCSRPRV